MDLYEACENGNEERVVEVLVYGERWHALRRVRRPHGSATASSVATTPPSPTRGRADATGSATGSLVDALAVESRQLAATLAESAKQLLSPRDLLRTRGTAGRTPLLAACMGAQLGVARLLLGESCLVYFTSRRADETEALLAPLRDEYNAFAKTQARTSDADNRGQEDKYFEVSLTEKHGGGSARVPVAVVRFPPARAVPPQDLLDGVTHVDDFGNTPLQCVSCFGCGTTEAHVDDGLALARQLLRHGDQPNLPKLANQWTPLHWAAYHGNHEMCAILLNPVAAMEGETRAQLGKTQFSIPLLVNDDNLFAADVAGRRGLALANEMRALRSAPNKDEYARWRLRLDHVEALRLFTREFLANATSLVRYVNDMNARLPRQLLRETRDKSASSVHGRHKRRRRLFTCADAIRYGQHLLYWMGCFGLEDEVRALLEMKLEMPTDLAVGMDAVVAAGDASHAFAVVHLRPLYVCSCEANKLQSVLHAVAVHGQQGIVQLLLEQMLYEQQHPQTAARVKPTSPRHRKTERRLHGGAATARKTATVAPTAEPSDGAAPAPLEPQDPIKLDVLPLAEIGWRNYRNESPLFLAVLFLRDDVVAEFREFLSPSSLAWELANCNVEGSYIHHVASDFARRSLGVVEAQQAQRLLATNAEYVMLFDGLTKRAFKESVIEAMREESVVTPSLRVTQVGHKLTPPSLGGLVPGACTDYVLLGATDAVLVRHAHALQLKIKHRGSTVRSKYNAATPHLFEPFRSLQRQQVVLDIVQKNVNLKKHLQKKNLIAVFPLHDVSGCKNIMRHWVRTDDQQRLFQPFVGDSLSQFLLERRTHQYEMLWPLLTYFGEKHAFYYAFLLFYTVWLVVLAIPGALCQAAWSVGQAKYVSPLFGIFTSVWATLFVERWKRKRSEIQSTFGNFKRNRNEQAPEFYGDFQVESPERGVVDTTFPKSLQLARVYAGLPLLFTMAGLAVAIFIGVKLNASSSAILHQVFPWMPPVLSAYVIPLLNAVSMLVLDNVYTQVAVRLTQWENHRTVWEFESMLATKLFWFKFLNAFISLFWVAFVERDAPALRKQLVIIMGARQIWYMIQRSILPLLSVARAWQSAGFRLGGAVPLSETVAPQRKTAWLSLTHEWYHTEPPPGDAATPSQSTPPPVVLLQEMMQPSDFLMGKQMEVVLHFGYITMFVSVLPIAPLLALGSVVVSTRLDVACCTQAKRRPPFESETEVSTFMSILEFMSFAAVAVNCAVLFFTTMDDFDSLLSATTLAAKTGSSSSTSDTETLVAGASLYVNKLWALLVLEHLVLGLKALLSLSIDDAASWVQNDEDRHDDETTQIAQLERARRLSLNLSPRARDADEDEKSFGDAAAPPPVASTTMPPTLSKLASEKYELAVHERNDALERERQLHHQLSEYKLRLEELESNAVLSAAVVGAKATSAGPISVSKIPRVAPPVSKQRVCWVCFLLHGARGTEAQRRCLTCRQFLCSECDDVVHLDDLGVREPKHFRVNSKSCKSSGSEERLYDATADLATATTPKDPEDTMIQTELQEMLVEYLSHAEPSESVATVLSRCHGSETLVVRFLRNARRQRAFQDKTKSQ